MSTNLPLHYTETQIYLPQISSHLFIKRECSPNGVRLRDRRVRGQPGTGMANGGHDIDSKRDTV